MADRVLSVVFFSSGAVCGSSGFSMWLPDFVMAGVVSSRPALFQARSALL